MRWTACAVAIAGMTVLAQARATEREKEQTAPILSLWYRGGPGGAPRASDLAAIRVAGFSGVTWPSRQVAAEHDLSRLAGEASLLVTLALGAVPLTPASARSGTRSVDVRLAGLDPDEIGALVWRALGHGSRVVSFDPGNVAGAGLTDAAGRPAGWLGPVRAIADHLSTNAHLFSEWQPAGTVLLDRGSSDAVDVVLLADRRSWVLVVTNASRGRARAIARLPAGVRSALWVDLLSGSMMSMINEPAGPRWSLELPPGAAFIYVVNK